MYYFENNPLDEVYADLYGSKTPTHYDEVLKLKGSLKAVFSDEVNQHFWVNTANKKQTLVSSCSRLQL